jgi:hypothetical protein
VTGPGSPAALAPPFLVGAALAVVGEVAVGLLLYVGPGFIPALSVILAVVLLALAVGLRAGSRMGRRGSTEKARRRWLPLLVAVSVAALFSGLWEVFRGFQDGPMSQGAGLALLAALPMYTGGVLLGGFVPDSGERGWMGPPALAGAGVGVLGAGYFLFPAFSPTVILLLCLMVLSGAALLHGRVLDHRVAVETVRELEGGVRMERWLRIQPPMVRIAIFVGERLRLLLDGTGAPAQAQEAVVWEGIPLWTRSKGRVLALGGGTGGVARRLAGEDPGREVLLLDRSGPLLEVVAGEVPGPAGEGLRIRRESIGEALLRPEGSLPPGPFDLILLEWGPATVGGLLDRFPPAALERVRGALGEEGLLVLFPLAQDPEAGEEGLLTLARDVARSFPQTVLYVGRAGSLPWETPTPAGRRGEGASGGTEARTAVLVAGLDSGRRWPEGIQGFLQVPVRSEESAKEESDAARTPL